MTAEMNYYHERQWLGHCAIHTLNNLLQSHSFTYQTLKAISNQLYSEDMRMNGNHRPLCSLNPYHSHIPYLGYFDISCIVMALKTKDCEIVNHLLRVQDVDHLELNSPLTIGFILNLNNSSLFGLWNSRHWFSILYDQEHKSFVNLDSQLSEPEIFLNEKSFLQFLKNSIQENSAQIFVISRIAFTGG